MDIADKNVALPLQDVKNRKNVDEIIISYYFKSCSCYVIFFTFLCILFLWCPAFFILFFCVDPYKRVIIVDLIRNVLIICDRGMIPCCKLKPKTYFINSIKKVIIYITWKKDETIGFNKLYFINCDIISIEGENEILFSDIEYTEEKLNKFLTFFRTYFDTEFRPADNKYIPDLPNEINNPMTTNTGFDENKEVKPLQNEEAAIPVNV